jgi:hypothetical protein
VFKDIYWKYNIMNRSYSKIRHIQEANQRLEKRIMSEQVQTTVTQTGENPGTKTKINPPMSKAIPEISGDTPTTTPTITNPFKDPSLLDKFVGKQFNTYSVISGKNKPDEMGNTAATYEIKKARIGVNTDLELDLIWKSSLLNLGKIGEGTTAYFSCDSDKLGMTATNYSDVVFAPSLIKDLKQTFCTVGAGGRSVAKVDYPTP